MTMRGGNFNSWDNNKFLSLLDKFECALNNVMISNGNPVQTSFLRVSNYLVEGSCGIVGISCMDVKIDFKAQISHL